MGTWGGILLSIAAILAFDVALGRVCAVGSCAGLKQPAAAQNPYDDAAALTELLCERSIHFYDEGIGNQIEYTAPDGTAYLWHPESDTVVIGTWQVETPDGGIASVCYRYDPGAFENYLGEPICFSYGGLAEDLAPDGIRDGDPYGLADGTIPAPLPAHPMLDPGALRAEFPDVPRGPTCTANLA